MKKNFRFFDNRQKYLLFVTTTNEKNKIADALKPIVQNLKPKNPALSKIYELSEKIRCEMLGSKMLNGIKKNLENNYYQKINSKKYKDVNAKKDINVLDAFELYIIEKFFTTPTDAPSGVSDGQIYPQDELCNLRGGISFPLESIGVDTRLKCDMVLM